MNTLLGGTNIPVWVVLFAAAIVIAASAWIVATIRQTKRLRQRFGPEYARAVEQQGDARRAEKVLQMREKRLKELHIRDLADADGRRFREAWQADQMLFVDAPEAAVRAADRLVTDVLAAKGYPTADFEQRAADISVTHPMVVESYRKAHEIALQHQRGAATIEDLRNAMVCYRALLEELLGTAELRRLAA